MGGGLLGSQKPAAPGRLIGGGFELACCCWPTSPVVVVAVAVVAAVMEVVVVVVVVVVQGVVSLNAAIHCWSSFICSQWSIPLCVLDEEFPCVFWYSSTDTRCMRREHFFFFDIVPSYSFLTFLLATRICIWTYCTWYRMVPFHTSFVSHQLKNWIIAFTHFSVLYILSVKYEENLKGKKGT